jgi:DNA-binding MarR family transcriptional regulator
MGVDRATTGPKFIRALEADGLVSIERHPEIDKRKDFLAPTKKLERLVEGELGRSTQSHAPRRRFAAFRCDQHRQR